jgi:hypothetical protein
MTWMADVSLEPSPPRVAFGPAAQRYAASLPADISLIAADREGAAAALAAAVERRRQGRPFYAAVLLDDVRASASAALSGALYASASGADERRRRFDALADDRVFRAIGACERRIADDTPEDIDARARVVLGLDGPLADARAAETALRGVLGLEPAAHVLRTMDEAERRVLRDFALTGDALLARSRREADRLATLLGRRRAFTAIAPGRAAGIPPAALQAGNRSTVVVWAPECDAAELGIIAMALDDIKAPVVYVCASGAVPGARGSFVRLEYAPVALRDANVIVDATIGDPAPAIGLAAHALGLVTASTSGAAEFLDGVDEYDPWNWRSVYAAVAAASARGGAWVKTVTDISDTLARTLARAAAPEVSPEPLVSVLVVTCNRPHMLNVALQSLANQTYKNIEIILVNNGSASVADVVTRYPSVRLIEPGRNLGLPGFFEIAMREMRGDYFCALADDDIDFPDFLARLVFALERTGASVAHGNTVTRYFNESHDRDVTAAYRVRSDRALDPLTITCGATMTMQSMLFRRSVVDEIGGTDRSLGALDLDYQIRAAQQYDFVHVDSVTSCWNHGMRAKSFNTSDELAQGLQIIFERYPAGSKIVERMRLRELKRFKDRASGVLWAPDLVLEDPPNGPRCADEDVRSVKGTQGATQAHS